MRILFVCLGNICRSPTAEAVLRYKLEQAGLSAQVQVDSAGTGDWHVGQAPDLRTVRAAAARGYDMRALRGRQVAVQDFSQFDLLLAMDLSNLAVLKQLRPSTASAELDLFLRRYQLPCDEVPDPYYGGEQGFEQVLDLLELACDALLQELRSRL